MQHYSIFKSPIGELLLIADTSALTGLYFLGESHVPIEGQSGMRNDRHPILKKAAQQLSAYFRGDRTSFSVPLSLSGTEFQKRIWSHIAEIPYGQTVTYSELASHAESPRAIRAAGTSAGRNPICIIIPCHRVMGKNGSLRGFAGGLDRKRRLLQLEGLLKKNDRET